MEQGYYSHSRSEALALIQSDPTNVLDVGCGRGGVTRELKRRYPGISCIGLDVFVDPDFDYSSVFDDFQRVDLNLEGLPIDISKFDLIILLDVLEHLSDPGRTLDQIRMAAKSGCKILISLPNFHYYSNLFSIIRSGRFEYQDAGILDRTHLRFFGYQDAKELIETRFHILDTLAFNPFENIKSKIIRKIFGKAYGAYQNIFLCEQRHG